MNKYIKEILEEVDIWFNEGCDKSNYDSEEDWYSDMEKIANGESEYYVIECLADIQSKFMNLYIGNYTGEIKNHLKKLAKQSLK